MKNYSNTIKYLKQLQKINLKTFTTKLNKKKTKISKKTTNKTLNSPIPFNNIIYKSKNKLYTNQISKPKFSNKTHKNPITSKIKNYNKNYNSFNHTKITNNTNNKKIINPPKKNTTTIFNYHYTNHNTHNKISTSNNIKLPNINTTQNKFTTKNTTIHYSQNTKNKSFLPSPQNYPQPININPLTNLSKLTKKTNFISKLTKNNITQSQFNSQKNHNQINHPTHQYNYPKTPHTHN